MRDIERIESELEITKLKLALVELEMKANQELQQKDIEILKLQIEITELQKKEVENQLSSLLKQSIDESIYGRRSGFILPG